MNAHGLFQTFHNNITVSSNRKAILRASRVALQKRIIEHFKTKPNVSIPKFYIQGSYKMGTMITAKDGTYDVDLGIYFLQKPTIEPPTLQKWILEAVKGHTTGGTQHKEKCIRVIYKGDFDIDLPVYYLTESDKHPYLATKNGWCQSDPKELCDWFKLKKDRAGQMIRLVRYFKAWADERAGKMPSGIALTVWVANNFKPNDRDDVAFLETAKAIKSACSWNVSCKNPATPGDNLVSKLDNTQINNFSDAFKTLIKDAEQAVNENSVKTASNIWKKQFGTKFPS